MLGLFLIGFGYVKEKDYSKYLFSDVIWTKDGVNAADLCKNYTYNEDTKESKLYCFEAKEYAITIIKALV